MISVMSRPVTADRGLVDGDRTRIGREFPGHVIKHDILEYEHRVGVFQCGPKHSARVFDRCGGQHLDAGNVRVPAFQAVRMLGGDLTPAAGRKTDHQRYSELITRHMPNGCGAVEDLIKREQAEVDGHQFHDRTHAGHGGADAGAGESPIPTTAYRECVLDRIPPANLC